MKHHGISYIGKMKPFLCELYKHYEMTAPPERNPVRCPSSGLDRYNWTSYPLCDLVTYDGIKLINSDRQLILNHPSLYLQYVNDSGLGKRSPIVTRFEPKVINVTPVKDDVTCVACLKRMKELNL